MPSPGKALFSLIRSFVHHLDVLNYSPRTIEGKAFCLDHFSRYLDALGIRDIRSVSRAHIDEYLPLLRCSFREGSRRMMRDATVCDRWHALHGFFRFLVIRGHLLFDPTAAIDPPRLRVTGERIPLTIAEMEAILSGPTSKKNADLRDRAILEILYATGIRRQEIVSLTLFDVDLAEQTVRIRGKGRRERLVPLGETAASALSRYLHQARPSLHRKRGEKALFINKYGEPLAVHAVQCAIDRHTARAGITRRVTPHLIRHTCASHLLEGGADIFSIQQILGHAKAETTQRYVKTSLDTLTRVHEHCHPRGKTVQSGGEQFRHDEEMIGKNHDNFIAL
jgi:integrase/recombinase XerD